MTRPADTDPAVVSFPAGHDTSCLHGPVEARRICAWCEGPIPAKARRDAVCCSKRCRQARHRFTRALTPTSTPNAAAGREVSCVDARCSRDTSPPGPAGGTVPGRRLAYADPPYPGMAGLYRDHPDYGGEVDHGALLNRLAGYDAWALSTSARALPDVLALCPPGVRVAAWHRGERPTRSRWPLPAWEPVIYHGGRTEHPAEPAARRVDSLVHGVAPMTTLPGRVIGAKPAAFSAWLFALLAAGPCDTLDDLFPGSGAVTRAWAAFTAATSTRRALPAGSDASRVATADASRRAGHDGSVQVLHDASGPAAAGHPSSRRTSTPRCSRDTSPTPALTAAGGAR